MLLTCKSCGNTYVVDDAEWANPEGGGKICEQCQEPLSPLMAGGGDQAASTSILQGYSFDGMKAAYEAQQAGGPPHEMGVPDYNAPPPYQPPSPGYNEPNLGYGAPPPMGGMAPDMGYGPPQHGGAPPPTQAMDAIGPGHSSYIGSNESTMAIDLDNLQAGNGSLPGMAPPVKADPHVVTGSLDTAAADRRKKQVIIGAQAKPASHDERTAAIDISQASAYAALNDGPPPQAQQQPQRPRQIPGQRQMHPQQMHQGQQSGGRGMLFVFVGFFLLLVVGGIIAFVFFFVISDGDSKKSSGGGGDGAEELAESFDQRIAAVKEATAGLMLPPVTGEVPTDGQLITVTVAEGIYESTQLVVPYSGGEPSSDQYASGTQYLTNLAGVLAESDPSLPVIVLADSNLSLRGLFPVMYTALATGRRVLLAGDTTENPALVGTIEFLPWNFAAPPTGEFLPPTKKTDLRIILNDDGLVVSGKDVDPEGVKRNELELEWFTMPNLLPKALANAKGANSKLEAVRFVPGGDSNIGKFVEVVQIVRGEDYNFPRFTTLYLEPPP